MTANSILESDGRSYANLLSLTIVEVYTGEQIEALRDQLSNASWIDLDDIDRLTIGADNVWSGYMRMALSIDLSAPASRHFGRSEHLADAFPPFVEHLYLDIYPLGSFIVACIYTFCLRGDEGREIDRRLRHEIESLRLAGGTKEQGPRADFAAERARVRNFRSQQTEHCLQWIRTNVPGDLCNSGSGLGGPPSWALIELRLEDADPERELYSKLLGLDLPLNIRPITRLPFIRVIVSWDDANESGFLAIADPGDQRAASWIADSRHGIHDFHGELDDVALRAGISALLKHLRVRLLSAKVELSRFSFKTPLGSDLFAVRNNALELSKDLYEVCADLRLLLNRPGIILGNKKKRSNPSAANSEGPSAEVEAWLARQYEEITNLLSDEVSVREITQSISTSIIETRGLDLQDNISNLTSKLHRLTKWILVLTIVAAGIGLPSLLLNLLQFLRVSP